MAKKTEQPAASTSSALATVDESALLEAFGDFDFEVGATGLEEVDRSDIRFASKIWNLKSRHPTEDRFMRQDEFLDTLTEQTTDSLRCVFVSLHKTNDFSFYDNDLKETVRVCTSYDRVTGTMRKDHPKLPVAAGETRECESCPDSKWQKTDKGKNVRNCSDVYGVFAVELDDKGGVGQPFMIRFKKTSLPAFKTHIQKHHLGRMKRGGRIGNVPLFAFAATVTLKMDDGGQYAFPVIERGELLPRTQINALAEQAKMFLEMADDVTKAVESRESSHGDSDAINTEGQSLRGDDFTA